MSNHKFKVGDTIIRVQDVGDLLSVGTVVVVREVHPTSLYIKVHGYKGGFHAANFEHYVEQPVVDSEAVLAPLKVFEHILAGTPLEYRTFSGSNWHTLEYCENITTASFKVAEFRVKPQTVKVNDIDVPAPVDTVALGYPDKVYGINLGRNLVYDTTGHTKRGYFWATEEDAQAVLDAILTSFSK